MTLKEFKANIDALIKRNPSIAEAIVVSSSDDEGNSFHLVYFGPTVGKYDEKKKEFFSNEENEEFNGVPAVCIN